MGRWMFPSGVIVGVLISLSFGQQWVGARRLTLSPEEIFEHAGPEGDRALRPYGTFQAVSDGAGGLLIINTADTSAVKHVVPSEGGYAYQVSEPSRADAALKLATPSLVPGAFPLPDKDGFAELQKRFPAIDLHRVYGESLAQARAMKQGSPATEEVIFTLAAQVYQQRMADLQAKQANAAPAPSTLAPRH